MKGILYLVPVWINLLLWHCIALYAFKAFVHGTISPISLSVYSPLIHKKVADFSSSPTPGTLLRCFSVLGFFWHCLWVFSVENLSPSRDARASFPIWIDLGFNQYWLPPRLAFLCYIGAVTINISGKADISRIMLTAKNSAC